MDKKIQNWIDAHKSDDLKKEEVRKEWKEKLKEIERERIKELKDDKFDDL